MFGWVFIIGTTYAQVDMLEFFPSLPRQRAHHDPFSPRLGRTAPIQSLDPPDTILDPLDILCPGSRPDPELARPPRPKALGGAFLHRRRQHHHVSATHHPTPIHPCARFRHPRVLISGVCPQMTRISHSPCSPVVSLSLSCGLCLNGIVSIGSWNGSISFSSFALLSTLSSLDL